MLNLILNIFQVIGINEVNNMLTFEEAKEIITAWYKCHVPVEDLRVN